MQSSTPQDIASLLEIIRHNESVDDNGDPVGAKPDIGWETGYAAGVRCVYRFLKSARDAVPSETRPMVEDMMLQCPKCEKPVNFIYCPYCGTDQDAAPQSTGCTIAAGKSDSHAESVKAETRGTADLPAGAVSSDKERKLTNTEHDTGWIDVRDRMPEKGQFVLAYGPGMQGCTGGVKMSVYRWELDKWWDANMDYEEEWHPFISHWRPLPEPPK